MTVLEALRWREGGRLTLDRGGLVGPRPGRAHNTQHIYIYIYMCVYIYVYIKQNIYIYIEICIDVNRYIFISKYKLIKCIYMG